MGPGDKQAAQATLAAGPLLGHQTGMLSEALQRKLELLPTTPGVYLMKDRQGAVVYVGKARNLRARVGQYFQPQSSDTRHFVPFLEGLLGDLEVLLTPSEKDALLLENELIKKHKPRFNVRLRDDKNYLSLRLSKSHPYPRLEVVRRMHKDGARYFGPYSSASSIREALHVVNRHFQLRTCTDAVLGNRRRPCLQYQIQRCPGPCVLPVPQEEYQRSVQAAALFLSGKGEELTGELEGRMKQAARELQFERAAQLRDQVQAIRRSLEKQRTIQVDQVDVDVLGLHREGGLLELQLLFFRSGRLNGGRAFGFTRQEFPTGELVQSFLQQYYGQFEGAGAAIPKELLLPLPLPDAEALELFLSERRGEKVSLLWPERGEKVRLLEMAGENARHSFEERQRTSGNAVETLTRIQSRLRLPRLPRRIECFDMSTFQGQLTVGSQVAFTDGEPDRARYRLYKVRGEAGQDDFASMFQVLGRRFERGKKEADLPDLIVVDGGQGQLSVARAALEEAGLTLADVPLCGLAKSRVLDQPEKEGKGVRHSPERIFLPGQKNPIVLRQNTSEIFLLQRLRDEAHRFAITFHRKLRRERNFRSVLEEIPGVGEKRKRALLAKFGSLKRIRAATAEELGEVEGFDAGLAARVQAFLAAGGEGGDADAEPVADPAATADPPADAEPPDAAELELEALADPSELDPRPGERPEGGA